MILVTGDTHGSFNNLIDHCDKYLSKDDYIIICGDFGIMFSNTEACKKQFTSILNKPYTICFVDGNHENFDYLNSFPVDTWKGGKVHEIAPNIYHLMRGQIFNIDNKTLFTFGGANSIDKEYRIPKISWWKEEMPTVEEMQEAIENLAKCNNKVDYILTHALPTSQLPLCASILGFNMHGDGLTDFLDKIDSKVRFKKWYCGHYHTDSKLDRKHEVLYETFVEIK